MLHIETFAIAWDVSHLSIMPAVKAPQKNNISTQAAFANSKLIQNLGSNPEQYKFEGNFRNAWGRD